MSNKAKIAGIDLHITNPKLGAGGQGEAMAAQLAHDPAAKLVLKTVPSSKTTGRRISALVDLCLPARSPYLAGPLAWSTQGKYVQHIAPFAGGVDLDGDQPRSFAENLQIGHAFASLWTILEEIGIAHRDLAPSNVVISPDGVITLIDFDGYSSTDPKVPPSDIAGQHLMMAPELRLNTHQPGIESDRFSAAVLLNMILLGSHPAEGAAKDPKQFRAVMTNGTWPLRRRVTHPDDPPISILGPDLPKLFDQAFNLKPSERPTADQWCRALHRASNTLWLHTCGGSFIEDSALKTCPWCGAQITWSARNQKLMLKILRTGEQHTFDLKNQYPITLGRNKIPTLHQTVSGDHLQITRFEDQILLRCIGRNGMWVQSTKGWRPVRTTWLAKTPQVELLMGQEKVAISAS